MESTFFDHANCNVYCGSYPNLQSFYDCAADITVWNNHAFCGFKLVFIQFITVTMSERRYPAKCYSDRILLNLFCPGLIRRACKWSRSDGLQGHKHENMWQ